MRHFDPSVYPQPMVGSLRGADWYSVGVLSYDLPVPYRLSRIYLRSGYWAPDSTIYTRIEATGPVKRTR
jgi:hypothetical protein